MLVELLFVLFWIPSAAPLRVFWWDGPLAVLLYGLAYGLSLLRLPFVPLPYLCKTGVYLTPLRRSWDSYPMQAARLGGDCFNLLLTAKYIVLLTGESRWLALPLSAEVIRLAAEKGHTLFSALWQMLPHRAIALRVQHSPLAGVLGRYCAYYALEDDVRLTYILTSLKTRAAHVPAFADKLAYVSAFVLVPRTHGLRCDDVRDVAHGLVYIHPGWTNDPHLLVGQALRRSPWLFDPRYLPRPFYYRTQSNRLATLFVLRYARCCPPYAWYQFGHEIKVARYDFFFRVLRGLGLQLEQPVGEDGRYAFEPLRRWLGGKGPSARPLWSDDEVLAALRGCCPLPSAEWIAERYTYPLRYVEAVLLPKLSQSHDT